MIDLLLFLWAQLDYVAMAFIILGYFRMGARKIDGWLWTCIGSALLVICCIWIKIALGIAIGNAILLGLTICGFIRWRKKSQ